MISMTHHRSTISNCISEKLYTALPLLPFFVCLIAGCSPGYLTKEKITEGGLTDEQLTHLQYYVDQSISLTRSSIKFSYSQDATELDNSKVSSTSKIVQEDNVQVVPGKTKGVCISAGTTIVTIRPHNYPCSFLGHYVDIDFGNNIVVRFAEFTCDDDMSAGMVRALHGTQYFPVLDQPGGRTLTGGSNVALKVDLETNSNTEWEFKTNSQTAPGREK